MGCDRSKKKRYTCSQSNSLIKSVWKMKKNLHVSERCVEDSLLRGLLIDDVKLVFCRQSKAFIPFLLSVFL
jgi:hypothetical protein